MEQDDSRGVLNDVAEQLTALRIARGLELEEAARLAGIDGEALALAEAAESALDDDQLRQVAEAYGVDETAFFGGRTTPKEYLFGA